MNLLFDLDGTLADPFEGFKNSLLYGFSKNRLPAPSDAAIRQCIGPPLNQSLISILGVSPDLAPQVLEDYREHHSREGIYQYRFYDGASEVLESARKTHTLFVATSKPQVMALTLLKYFGYDQFFSGIYGSELDGVRSVKADLIQYLLVREKIKAQDAIMFGDRKHDTIGAKANQVRSVGVAWGYGSREELLAAGVERVMTSWPELGSWFSVSIP